MPLQIDFKNQNVLSLQDAIAYEVFMDNLKNCLSNDTKKAKEDAAAILELARLSFSVANLFILARTENTNKINDIDA